MQWHRARRIAVISVAMLSAGCTAIAGIDGDFSTAKGSGDGGSPGAGGGAQAGGGGGAATGGGGGAATGGGAGAGGASSCDAGAVEDCYSGAPGTEGVGACKPGSRTCDMSGGGWGPCEGDVTPKAETCATPEDDDCDGATNEEGAGCVCLPSSTAPCYTGPAGTEGKGQCKAGEKACLPSGADFGACEGDVGPGNEDCGTLEDEDCDGAIPDLNSGCLCSPGEVVPCYAGPPGTEGVGQCKAGEKTCLASGVEFGPCVGEVGPGNEDCSTVGDEDCDGAIPDLNSGCQCTPGELAPCYTGAPGTQGVGICASGLRQCLPSGTGFDVCAGQVTPGLEDCSTAEDDDCDGTSLDSDEGCVCVPGSMASCYTGPAGTLGIGLCNGGTKTCSPDGKAYGACLNEVLPGLENCMTPADEDCDGGADPCSGEVLWGKAFGDPSAQVGSSISIDLNNNPILSGQFAGSVTFGGAMATAGGPNDAFIASLSGQSGSHIWSVMTGGSGDDQALSVAGGSNGVIAATGAFTSGVDFGCAGSLTSGSSFDIFGAIFNGSTCAWQAAFGGTGNQVGNDVAVSEGGDVFITGSFASTTSFGGQQLTTSTGLDAFVAKFDAMGVHQWSKQFGGNFNQEGLSVATDSAGGVVFGGHFPSQAQLCMSHYSSGDLDIFVAKLDGNSGSCVWSRSFGDAGSQTLSAVAADASGNILVTGSFSGVLDFGNMTPPIQSAGTTSVFVAKLAPNGDALWAKAFGITGSHAGEGIDADGLNHVVVTGSFNGDISFGGATLTSGGGKSNAFVAKLDALGSHIWSASFGDVNSNQVGNSVAVTDAGTSFVTGTFDGAISANGVLLNSAGNGDIFVLKLKP